MATYTDRIFQGRSTFPDHEEWFYRAREGIAGPYLRREDAAVALRCYVKYCQDNGITGGRGSTATGAAFRAGCAALAHDAILALESSLHWAARALAAFRRRMAAQVPPKRQAGVRDAGVPDQPGSGPPPED
jgi:hypothetical protein